MTIRNCVRGAVAIALCAAPASAQQAPSAAPTPFAALTRCRAITAAAERLACYDAAAGALDDAVRSREITVLDREGVRETKRSLFGFATPATGIFHRADEPEFTQIDSVVSSTGMVSYDRYALVLPDGAQWQTTEPLRFPPKAGDKVTIRKGALGAFFISLNGRRSVRGIRTR